MNTTDLSSKALFDPLTRREAAILAHLVENKPNPEIAKLESLAPSSVKWYINQIFSKLGVKNREEAISRAKELGLLARSSTPPRNNLPRELTSYIGRDEAIAQVLRLVRAHALVTVTGSGGSGKTRLALKAAEKIVQNSPSLFPDGVWFVELAPIANRELVPQAVSNAIGLSEQHGISPSAALSEFLGSKQVLILLDNCEHVIEAASRLAHELLQACPKLQILATSREILGVEGEAPFRCPSLSLPDLRHPQPLAELAQSEAVRLFVERAERIAPGFSMNEENGLGIARICQRLDGIPLAIELAAARLRLLSVEQISARLDHTFRLLTGGSRNDLPRHQTLKALIDWSYNLLTEKERLLLLRLSVFAGGWTLEAAEAVCSDPPGGDSLLPPEEILDMLGQLVDKSLAEMAPRPVGGEPRYRMLETIRQYAHDHLMETGSVEAVRERHLDYFLALSLQADIELRGKHIRAWREKLDAELDNLRLAFEWAESGSVEKGLRLAAALYQYWQSYLEEEGILWLERLLTAEASAPEFIRSSPSRRVARGRALNILSDIGGHWGQDQFGLAWEATTIFQELGDEYQIDLAFSLLHSREKDLLKVLELYRKIGDPTDILEGLTALIFETMQVGDLIQARAYIEEGLALCRKMEYLPGEKILLETMWYLEVLEGDLPRARMFMKAAQECAEAAGESGNLEKDLPGWMALFQGNYVDAKRYFQDELAAMQKKGLTGFNAFLLGEIGRAAWAGGESGLAERYAEEALRLTGRVSDVTLRSARYVLARTAIVRGEFELALADLKDSLLNWSGRAFSIIPVQLILQTFGILAAAQSDRPGQTRRAAVLFGSQDFISKNLMNIMGPPEREAYQQSLAVVLAALSTEEFAAAWAEGQAMNLDQAVQFAMDENSTGKR